MADLEETEHPKPPIFFDPNNFGRRVLLTGAGWTKNWGGYLSEEFTNRLLSKPQVRAKRRLLDLCHSSNFEDALQKAWDYTEDHIDEADAGDGPELQAAVMSVFEDMQADISRRHNHAINMHRVQKFLSRFARHDAPTGFLFTLNQDFWFESNYYSFYRGSRPQTPGVSHGNVFFTPNAFVHTDGFIRQVNFKAGDRLRLDGCNNVVKLHGSANWRDTNSQQMMIVGGNKLDRIHGEQLLLDYYELFEEVLCLGDVRMMVIGYGWRDHHINEVITKAVAHHGLTVWNWNGVTSVVELQRILCAYKAANVGGVIHGLIDRPFQDIFHPEDTETAPWDDRIEQFFSR